MEVVKEQGGLEGASVPMPYVSGAGEKRRKSCQKVVGAEGAAELVSPRKARRVILKAAHSSFFWK